jgi:hypothetical protein
MTIVIQPNGGIGVFGSVLVPPRLEDHGMFHGTIVRTETDHHCVAPAVDPLQGHQRPWRSAPLRLAGEGPDRRTG